MRKILMMLFLLSLSTAHAKDGPLLWDGLPAVDADHLLGPYAGRRICPMCRHGYDAGILIFLRSDVAVSDVRRLAADLRAVNKAVDDPRFRVFVLVTGAAPSAALLEVLQGTGSSWNIAHLPVAGRDQASRDFALALDQGSYGLVFAQRRLLWRFDPLSLPAASTADVRAHAEYAMRFLRASYPEAGSDSAADTPKGQLWTAPTQLAARLSFGVGGHTRICFRARDADRQGAAALVSMALASAPDRLRWARSDAEGCVAVEGIAVGQRVNVELYQVLLASARTHFTLTEAAGLVIPLADAAVADVAPVSGEERVVGLPCDGCDAVFDGLPPALAHSARIARMGEPGEPLHLHGTVRNSKGRPRSGVVIYAYQTDRTGRYPRDPAIGGSAARHGRLRAWAISDADGAYAFDSIRPGSYPFGREPQHIHMHVIEPGRCTYYLGDVLFDDDPHLSAAQRIRSHQLRGGSGVVQPRKLADGSWDARRDITLGANVPGYQDCGA